MCVCVCVCVCVCQSIDKRLECIMCAPNSNSNLKKRVNIVYCTSHRVDVESLHFLTQFGLFITSSSVEWQEKSFP